MTQFIDRAGLPEATDFIRSKLSAFDLSKLDKLTLAATLRTTPLSWRVKKPVRVAKGSRAFKSQFEIHCSVISDLNFSDDYRDISVPVIWGNESLGSPELSILLGSRAEMLVFAAGAGCYHFLRRTKQAPGVARNSMARRYACAWVAEFMPGCMRFRTNDPNKLERMQPCYTCFGVELPQLLVDDNDAPKFFEYEVERYVHTETGENERAVVTSMHQSVGEAIRRSFGDCDPELIGEIVHGEDVATAWLVLADWLEDRGDQRAHWIRSHRVDLTSNFPAEVRRRFERPLRLARPPQVH